jgi:hypothetical protein
VDLSKVTPQALVTCLAKGLVVPEDDPRMLWLVAQLLELPADQQ